MYFLFNIIKYKKKLFHHNHYTIMKGNILIIIVGYIHVNWLMSKLYSKTIQEYVLQISEVYSPFFFSKLEQF